MKKFLKLLPVAALAFMAVFVGTGASASCLGTGTSCTENTTVQVTIDPGDICIGSTGSFDFGNYTVSSSNQTVTGAFTDEFWVEDLKGADAGYYTTLQLSADLSGPGGATIPRANVSVKTANTGSAGVTTMAGTANTRVVVDAGMASYQTLDSARTYIKRDNAANSGVIGKYGALPQLQVVIPAYQSVGVYTATLVYTLYEN